MIRITRRLSTLSAGVALALVAPLALAAAPGATHGHYRAEATAFIHALGAGEFKQAEAHFTAQMRRHASPAKLQSLWKYMQKQFGSYAKTEGSDTMRYHGNPMVIVHTVFKRQAVGLAVFFNRSHEIAGLRVVPIR
jgi:hypothetical protein